MQHSFYSYPLEQEPLVQLSWTPTLNPKNNLWMYLGHAVPGFRHAYERSVVNGLPDSFVSAPPSFCRRRGAGHQRQRTETQTLVRLSQKQREESGILAHAHTARSPEQRQAGLDSHKMFPRRRPWARLSHWRMVLEESNNNSDPNKEQKHAIMFKNIFFICHITLLNAPQSISTCWY